MEKINIEKIFGSEIKELMGANQILREGMLHCWRSG
tara:strand:+ start:85 stop:192 length:108 start_codon:yes stop_codon:yes gene_type:complete